MQYRDSRQLGHLAYFYRAILSGPVPNRLDLAGLKTCATTTKERAPGSEGACTERSDGSGVQAEDLLRRAIDLNPGFAEAYVRLADLYAQEEVGRLEEALPLMRTATELEPDNVGYWVDLGKLLLRLNRSDEAREVGRRGLAVAPRSAGSRELLEAFLRGLERR